MARKWTSIVVLLVLGLFLFFGTTDAAAADPVRCHSGIDGSTTCQVGRNDCPAVTIRPDGSVEPNVGC